jgi:hypothetical protein
MGGATHVLVALAAGGDVAAASIGDGNVDTDDCLFRQLTTLHQE